MDMHSIDIIVRRVRGGFQAGYQPGIAIKGPLVFGPLGKSKDEAIGKLVLKHRQVFEVARVRWDRKDKWTNRYLAGKPNRRLSAAGVDCEKLPQVTSSQEAALIHILDLPLPLRLRKGLMRLAYTDKIDPLTLGSLRQYSKKEIRKRSYYIGARSLRMLEELLAHYGIALKK